MLNGRRRKRVITTMAMVTAVVVYAAQVLSCDTRFETYDC